MDYWRQWGADLRAGAVVVAAYLSVAGLPASASESMRPPGYQGALTSPDIVDHACIEISHIAGNNTAAAAKAISDAWFGRRQHQRDGLLDSVELEGRAYAWGRLDSYVVDGGQDKTEVAGKLWRSFRCSSRLETEIAIVWERYRAAHQ